MKSKAITDKMLEKGYWKTSGKTPWATLYSAITREIQKKGKDAPFVFPDLLPITMTPLKLSQIPGALP